ncbi:heterokaryon incompatibility protein-domain-containing protein [Xylariales sp. AK1849]|nr:heterokaryon incompatibility protein-domain-containing protein [Xylariales sp. AK1849]
MEDRTPTGQDSHSCSICRQVVIDLDKDSERYPLGELGRLKTQEGAESCELLQQYFGVTRAPADSQVEVGFLHYRGRRNELYAAIMRAGYDELDENDEDALLYHAYAKKDDPVAKSLPYRPPGLDIGSQRAFKLAKKWLRSCFYGHPVCPGPNRIPLPTRVIDVTPDHIRLILAREEGLTYGRYVALSYCWGGPQPIYTTRETLAVHTREIPFQDLPQTLKDAITVTRELGLQYLWVDALCIVQDDTEDQRREVSRMAQIYNCAYVTVSASTASTCYDGFLGPRKLTHGPIRLPAKASGCKMGSVVLMHDPCGEQPIQSRGWTLQEHLLSPRLLTFGPLRLEYRCMNDTVHDGGWKPWNEVRSGLPMMDTSVLFAAKYGGFPQPRNDNWKKLQQVLLRTHLMRLVLKVLGETLDYQRVLVENWADIVTAYTSRSLRYPEDRLKAIAGIAEKIHCADLGDYLAGIFSSELYAQLLWSRPETQPRLPRPSDYRAPSWSWAAVDGKVEYDMNLTISTPRATAEILQCTVSPASELERYTRYKAGILRIHGKTALLDFDVHPRSRTLCVPPKLENLRFHGDAADLWKRDSVQVCLLQITQEWGSVKGLVLKETEHNGYRRVGYFQMMEHGQDESYKEPDWIEREIRII